MSQLQTCMTEPSELAGVAAGIAHDLNNQLTLVLNYLEVADWASARSATARCAALVSQIVNSCQGTTIRTEPVEVRSFLKEFCREFQWPAGISVDLKVKGEPVIQADPLSLHRILSNLVNNACEAMQGSGAVWIRAAGTEIAIIDSGPGIRADRRSRIFEPYFSTKSKKGRGLGLYVVRDLMRRQGGMACLADNGTPGACFELRFAEQQ